MLGGLEFKKEHLIFLAIAFLIGLTVGRYVFYDSGTITGKAVSPPRSSARKAVSLYKEASGQNTSFGNIEEFHGLYEISVKMKGREVPFFYITEDGNYLFGRPTKLETLEQRVNSQNQNDKQQGSFDAPDKEKPTVELFIMAFCPYGGKAEQTMEPVYDLLGVKVNWDPHYIVSEKNGQIKSLHGPKEVKEDKRELCVLENNGVEKWFDFVTYVNENCGSSGSCWQAAANEIGLDPEKISTCVEERGTKLLKQEAQISKEKGAQGSPTLFINGKSAPKTRNSFLYQYGNPEAYKQAICSGFTTPPEVCNTELRSSNSSSTGGEC